MIALQGSRKRSRRKRGKRGTTTTTTTGTRDGDGDEPIDFADAFVLIVEVVVDVEEA